MLTSTSSEAHRVLEETVLTPSESGQGHVLKNEVLGINTLGGPPTYTA